MTEGPTAAAANEARQDWRSVWRLATLHYLLFLALYGVYGYQVCPLLEQLSLVELLGPAAAVLMIQLSIRMAAGPLIARIGLPSQVRLWFWLDFGLFAAGGLALALFNLEYFQYPWGSNGKVMVAFLIGGLYASLDLTFEREMRLAAVLRASGRAFPTGARFLPYQTKFLIFSTVNLAVVGLVVMMVVLKDVLWATGAKLSPQEIQRAVMIELVCILAILGGYVTRAVRQYSRKTNAALADENAVLREVGAGSLTASVTVASNDEFGQMALLTNQMIEKLRRSYADLVRTQDATISALVSLSAKRDNETGLHIKRTRIYVTEIAKALRARGAYADALTDVFIDRLDRSAPLHDVGKVGVPDRILCKPGRLDADEFAVMKTHAEIGAAALAEADRALGGSSFLEMARDIALTHHEKWDGSGYPRGLEGEEIPLAGRLMALADVYDALRSRRVYKPAMTHAAALEIIREGRGRHFDPAIVDAFLSIEGEIERISVELADQAEEQAPPAPRAAPLPAASAPVGNGRAELAPA